LSEYKKQIATGAVIAILMAGILGFGVLYFPTQPAPVTLTATETTSTTSTSFATSTTTEATTTSSVSSITSSSTSTIQTVTYTNHTVLPDSRLAVAPLGNFSSNANATSIAADLASGLGELPIQLVSKQLNTCFFTCDQSIYAFRTALGSNITVYFTGTSFYLLLYEVQNYTAYNQYWTNHTTGSPPTAEEDVAVGNLMLKAYGLDLSRVSFASFTQPGWATWSQEYKGLPIANSSQITFNVYPPKSLIIRLETIAYAGWSLIPSNFPLDVSPSTALASAEAYAADTLHIGNITSASIAFQVIHGDMYYCATVGNQSEAYILYVNPVTGEVGFPTG